MATLLALWKFQMAYLNSQTRKTLLIVWESPGFFFVQNWNWCIFCLFLPKFGCHGNSLGYLKISDSIFNFADPDNLIIRVKKSSIFLAEVKLVQFLFIFAQIWLPWQLLWLPWNFRYRNMFEIADPENPTINAKIVLISCTQMPIMPIRMFGVSLPCGYRQFSRFLRKIVEIV